jgi:hypothetical protein
MTRAGYLKWRADLKQFHARKSGEILHELGFPAELITRVQDLNLKKHFPADAETRVLEDALCLVFLEHQLVPLMAKTEPDKITNAIQKTWGKMTPAAHAIALAMPQPPAAQALIAAALANSSAPSH